MTPGDSSEGFAAGDDDPARPPTRRNRSTSTSSSTCSTSRPAKAIRQNQAGFGNALAGRGPQLNEAYRRPAPAGRQRPAGAADDRRTRAPTSPASGGRSRTSRRRSPRWPRRRPASSSPSTAPSPPSPASPAPTSRKRSRKARARSTRSTPTCRRCARSSADSARFFTALKPGAKALGETSPIDRRSAPRRRPGAQRLAGPQQPAAADRGSAGRLPERPGRLQRPRPADRHQRPAEAGAAVHRPGPDHLQLPDPRLPATSPTPTARATARATGSTSSPSSRPKGPTARAAPSSAPANGPDRANHLHFNPYPEHRRAGPAQRL